MLFLQNTVLNSRHEGVFEYEHAIEIVATYSVAPNRSVLQMKQVGYALWASPNAVPSGVGFLLPFFNHLHLQ